MEIGSETNEVPQLHVQEGEDKGRIADPGEAQELANLEKPARDREITMEKEHETGLTEEERKNIEVMQGVKKKYPNLETADTEYGPMVVATERNAHMTGSMFVFTQKGLFRVNSPGKHERIDRNKLGSLLIDRGDSIGEPGNFYGYPPEMVYKDDINPEVGIEIRINRIDTTDEDALSRVRPALQARNEEWGRQERVNQVSAADILSKL